MWVEEAGGMAGPANLGGEFVAGGRVGRRDGGTAGRWLLGVRGLHAAGKVLAGSLACEGRACPSLERAGNKGAPFMSEILIQALAHTSAAVWKLRLLSHLSWCFSMPPWWLCKTKGKPVHLQAACSLPVVRTRPWVTWAGAPLWEWGTSKQNPILLQNNGLSFYGNYASLQISLPSCGDYSLIFLGDFSLLFTALFFACILRPWSCHRSTKPLILTAVKLKAGASAAWEL